MGGTEKPFSDPEFLKNDGFSRNLTAANTSLLYPSLLSPAMDKTISIIMITMLLIVMVSMGCTMEVAKIKDHILKPKGVAIAILSQYGIMPLAAFCLTKGFQVPEATAVVILICGCCPGGTLSNVLTLAVKGDMNLSIVMTSCSTLLALAMMPLLLYLYCHGFSNLQKAVPYVGIVTSLAAILIPCGAGILINYFRPQYSKIITKVGICLLLISIPVICIISIVEIGSSLLTMLSPRLMAIAVLLPLIGYIFGYIISWVFRLTQPERRTVAMETGCQNIQLCATVVKVAFPPAAIGPMYMFPLVLGFFQITEAVLLIVLFRCYHWFTTKGKDSYEPTATEEKLKEISEETTASPK